MLHVALRDAVVTVSPGAVAVTVNRTLWLLRQVARENGWTLDEQLQVCTDYIAIPEEERPVWGSFLDERATQHRSRAQVLLTKEDVRGGVVRWMGDFLREVSSEVATTVRRLRVGDTLAVDGMTIKRIS